MKILFVLNTLAMGGAERVGSTLCNAWVAQGHEVVLVQSYSGGAINFFELDPRVRQEALAGNRGKRSPFDILQRIIRLRRLAREFRPDIIVSFLTNVNLVMLVATAFQGFPRIVAERTDPVTNRLSGIMRLGCLLLYPFADMVLVQNNQQGERLESLYGRMPRLTAIPNPLPEPLPMPRCTTSQATTRRVISLGRLEPGKRVDMIVTAFERLAAIHPGWELHIFGDGPSRAQLEQQAMAGPASARIRFLGRTDRALAEMAEADIYVSASTFEGFPNALMEAMAVGLPTVSTDCPCGPRDMTRNGEDGLLVPVNDTDALTEALSQLMGDDTLRMSLGERAARRIRSLCSRDAVLDQWFGAFSLLGVA